MQLAVGLFHFVCAALLVQGCGEKTSPTSPPTQPQESGSQYHFVAFAFKYNTTDDEKSMVMDNFLALKHKCMIDNKTFIRALSAGTQNSLENVGQTYTQGYMVKFDSSAQRDYYVGCIDKPCQKGGTKPDGGFCQAHDDFKVMAGPFFSTSAEPYNYTAGELALDYTAVNNGDLSSKVTHNVFFKFKDDTTQAIMDEARARFLKLKSQCEGIEVLVSGDQNSKEGNDQQYQQGYFAVLSTVAARDTYVGCLDKPCQNGGTKPARGFCQAHDDFKVFVGPHLDLSASAPDMSKPTPARNYNPGIFVFDFQSTTAEAETILI